MGGIYKISGHFLPFFFQKKSIFAAIFLEIGG